MNKTRSTVLLDYTGEWLEKHINTQMKDNQEVLQVLPTSKFREDPNTGLKHRDYLLIYKQ